METVEWQGCYGRDWGETICEQAKSHPAKFQYGLINRIIDYCVENGYVKAGDYILDPFGGIGTGGIICAYRGLQWVGVELERKFCNISKMNFDLHKHIWRHWGNPVPIIVNGDSVNMPIRQSFRAVITSPPFGELQSGGGLAEHFQGKSGYNLTVNKLTTAYVPELQASDKRNVALYKNEEYYNLCEKIYKNCLDLLMPAGIIALHVKDYVREGKIVPVGDNSVSLLQKSGFNVYLRVHAMMISETTQKGLFDDMVSKKAHKSFFRVIQERRGAPPIDYEEVIWGQKI